MNSSETSFVLDLQAAAQRLGQIETFSLGGRSVRVALPAAYATSPKQRFPLVFVIDGGAIFGSTVEMSRLMAETKEVQPCIVAAIEGAVGADFVKLAASLATQLLPACRTRYRVEDGKTALFGHGEAGAFVLHAALTRATGADQFIAGNPDANLSDMVIRKQRAAYERNGGVGRRVVLASAGAGSADAIRSLAANMELIAGSDLAIASRHIEGVPASAAAVPALVHGLRALLSTGGKYGAGISAMRKPLMVALMKLLGPMLGKALLGKPSVPVPPGPSHIMRADNMQRDFEVFVSMPASAVANPARRYPALVVLDANIEFATVAEMAAGMAAAGDMEETIVIGLGVPRAEGAVVFGFRRFEEFSPPAEGYDFNDDLGRVFRSMFFTQGQDARRQMGQAGNLHRFITDQMLPQLCAQLPVDRNAIGLLGHSAGGTYTAFELHQDDSPFSRYICISPGIAITGHWLMKQEGAGAAAKNGASVFLTIGSEEKVNDFNDIAGIPKTEAYTLRLRSKQVNARYRCTEGETHSSVYPQGVAAALAELYAANPAQVRRLA